MMQLVMLVIVLYDVNSDASNSTLDVTSDASYGTL